MRHNRHHAQEPRLRLPGRWYRIEENGQELPEPVPVIFTQWPPEQQHVLCQWQRIGSFIGEEEEQQLRALYVYAHSPAQARQFYDRFQAEVLKRFARLVEGERPA